MFLIKLNEQFCTMVPVILKYQTCDPLARAAGKCLQRIKKIIKKLNIKKNNMFKRQYFKKNKLYKMPI